MGRVVTDGSHGSLHVLLNPIYNMSLGVDTRLLSSIVFIQRIWDAMVDPFIGQFSDNFRSRWGRRLPLMTIAIIPLALLFGALWWFPRNASQNELFWYLLVSSLAFYASYALYSMPLGGLMLEATDDYHERTRLAGTALAFGFTIQIISQWVFPLTQLKFFPDTITGVRWVTGGLVVIFILCGFIPVMLCRERLYHRVAEKQPRTSIISGLAAIGGNRSALLVLIARFVSMFGYNIVGMLGLYMNTYYVFGGNVKAASWAYGFLGSSFHIAALVSSLFIYPKLEQRIGKRRTMQAAAALLMIGCLGKTVLYRPGEPWWQLIVLSINGMANAGFGLMSIAMLGDVADYDEYKSGMRREALFNSLLAWAEKAGNSLGSLLTGFLLVWIGFNAKLGAQSPHTLWLMKLFYVVTPAAGALIALVLIDRYPLSEERAYEIKAELNRRRAEAVKDSPGEP